MAWAPGSGWEVREAVPGDLLAAGEPHAGQGLHARDQPVHHLDPQRAPRDERVHDDVEIAADAILLTERRPPQIEYAVRIGDALRRVAAAQPGEAVVHRVVDGIVE